MAASMGSCANCNRSIPYGYLATVTKWAVKVWNETANNKLTVMVPEVLYCRDCASGVQAQPSRRLKHQAPTFTPSEPVVLTARQVLVKVWEALTKDKPKSSKELAEEVGVEDTELVLSLVRKLKVAGKASFVEGRWVRA